MHLNAGPPHPLQRKRRPLSRSTRARRWTFTALKSRAYIATAQRHFTTHWLNAVLPLRRQKVRSIFTHHFIRMPNSWRTWAFGRVNSCLTGLWRSVVSQLCPAQHLFFENEKARYTEGYKLIENAMLENAAVSGQLPMLGKAIDTIKAAVKKVQSAGALP
jgi:hypothetical protein